ncbi:unnamed protein product [Heterobilharzia americana]|nr:unnamed protein product [Heterobilharzia americana]
MFNDLITIIKVIFLYCTKKTTHNSLSVETYSTKNESSLNNQKIIDHEIEFSRLNDFDWDNISLLSDQWNYITKTKQQYHQLKDDTVSNSFSQMIKLSSKELMKDKEDLNEKYVKFHDTFRNHNENFENIQLDTKYQSKVSELYKKSLLYLCVYSSIFVMCFVGFLCCCILLVRHQENLLQQINSLPSQLKLISFNIEQFIQYAIDNAYMLTTLHVHNDALHQPHNYSLLNKFIGRVKYFVIEGFTCLTTDLCNKSSITVNSLNLSAISPPELENKTILNQLNEIKNEITIYFKYI